MTKRQLKDQVAELEWQLRHWKALHMVQQITIASLNRTVDRVYSIINSLKAGRGS